MASDTATVVLAIVGFGIIVVGIVLLIALIQIQQRPPVKDEIVREEVLPLWAGGWAPYAYWSRVPARPILY